MRNLIVVMLFAFSANAQMSVSNTVGPEIIGTYKMGGIVYAEIQREGENVVMIYKDIKYQYLNKYRSFVFPFSELETMYGLFSQKQGEDKTVDLADGSKITFNYKGNHVEIRHFDGNDIGLLPYFSKKKLEGLFGRN